MQAIYRRHAAVLAVVVVSAAVIAAGWALVHSPWWGGADRTYEVPWSEDRVMHPPTISPDGTTVTVYFTGGGCFKSATPQVDETPKSVTITVEVTDRDDAACSDIGLNESATVSLDEPLGDRRLVDGARN